MKAICVRDRPGRETHREFEQENEVQSDNYCRSSAYYIAHTEVGVEGRCSLATCCKFMSSCS